jgi:hypothetical protein
VQGAIGAQGAQGAIGAQGVVGAQGVQGRDGNFGGATFDYTFDSSTTASDPGTGKIRFNNATLSSASSMYIDATDDFATNIANYLATIDDSTSTIKGHFKISRKGLESTFALFTINTLTDNTGWYTVSCSYVSGAGTFSNNDDIVITFARTGDKGDTGAQGVQGTVGAQGATGSAGAQGIQGAVGAQGTIGAQGVQGATGPIAGLNTHIIFNDSGVANGSPNLTFNKTSGDLALAGSLKVDGISTRDTATTTTTAVTQIALFQYPIDTHDTCDVLIKAVSSGARHTTKLLITANSTVAIATEYGTLLTNASLFTVDVDISVGDTRVLITPASVTSTVFKATFDLITT